MMAYRRSSAKTYLVALPTRTGRVKISTGTAHRPTAVAMDRMLADLGPKGRRAWDLLDRVVAGSLELAILFDAYAHNDLDGLRRRIDDVDLEPHVAGWSAWLRDRVRPATRAHYVTRLRTLLPAGETFLRSSLLGAAVAQWLATRTALVAKRPPARVGSRRRADPVPRPVSASTKRTYLAAAQSFARYLVEVGQLASNPLRDVAAPRPAAPRCQFLELPDVVRVVANAPKPFGAILALAYGAGIEISAILALIESDIDVQSREVRARGTKAWTRDRIARVADWAWPVVEAHLATVTPGERLFRGIHRWAAGDAHRERCRVLDLAGYRLHDSRHHWAVRMVRAGMPLELVARQLGHRDVVMVARVYGRFVPNTIERTRWEQAATALDAEKWRDVGALLGAVARVTSHAPRVTGSPTSSRGGTRTRDPGIMSAVL